jgi:hypothetical protein
MLEFLNPLTTVTLGLFAGALLTEGAILVPYWRKMDPADFFRLHKEMGPGLFRFYAPLTIVAVMLAVGVAGIECLKGGASMGHLVAAGGGLAALSAFPLYFGTANKSFANHSIADEDLAAELRRWSSWHWARTIVVIVAFAASVVA